MKPLQGVEPIQDDCLCGLCEKQRACSDEYRIEHADTIPPEPPKPSATTYTIAQLQEMFTRGPW
jgi:hypothetical protein